MDLDDLQKQCETSLGRNWTQKRREVVEFLASAIESHHAPDEKKQLPTKLLTASITGISVCRFNKCVLIRGQVAGTLAVGDLLEFSTADAHYSTTIEALGYTLSEFWSRQLQEATGHHFCWIGVASDEVARVASDANIINVYAPE